MSHKSKKRKAQLISPVSASRNLVPVDFREFERQAERRAARHEELRYRIAPDCKVHIIFDGIATQEALRKLMDYIEMGIDNFPVSANNSPIQD